MSLLTTWLATLSLGLHAGPAENLAPPAPPPSGQQTPDQNAHAEPEDKDQKTRDTPDDHRSVLRHTPGLATWALPDQVIDRSQLQDAGSDLAEAINEQPGLRVTRLGGLGAFSMVSVRGSNADQVQVSLDGVPLNHAMGGAVDLSSLPIGPIASIAIYRGLSPTVPGSSAIGGVLAIRTRDLRSHRLELETGGGSFSSRWARLFYGYGSARWGAGVSLDYQGSEGNFSFEDDGGTAFNSSDDQVTERQNNAFNDISVLAKSHLVVQPGLRLTLMNLMSHRDGGVPGLGLVETRLTQLSQSRNLLALQLESLNTRPQAAVTAYLAWSRSAFDDPLGEISLGSVRSRQESLVPGLNLTLRAPIDLDTAAQWKLIPSGLVSWRLDHFQPAPDDSRGPSTDRHALASAAGLQLQMRPIDARLHAAARYEHAWSQQTGAADTQQGAPSWRVAWQQRGIPQSTLELSVGHGLRLPSLFELFGNTGTVLGNPDLKPERALTVSAALVHDAAWLTEGWWQVELAGFSTWVEDLIQLVQNAQNVSRPDNVDRAWLAGLEFGSNLDLFQHLRLNANLTWTHSENRSAIAARQGRQLPFRPTWQAWARLELYHDFQRQSLGEIGLRIELDHISGNALDHANLVQVPARWLLGVGLHSHLWKDQLRLDLSLRNVTESRVQDLSGFPMPGLSVMASLRWQPELADQDKEMN